jgi:hypothetical protein
MKLTDALYQIRYSLQRLQNIAQDHVKEQRRFINELQEIRNSHHAG